MDNLIGGQYLTVRAVPWSTALMPMWALIPTWTYDQLDDCFTEVPINSQDDWSNVSKVFLLKRTASPRWYHGRLQLQLLMLQIQTLISTYALCRQADRQTHPHTHLYSFPKAGLDTVVLLSGSNFLNSLYCAPSSVYVVYSVVLVWAWA